MTTGEYVNQRQLSYGEIWGTSFGLAWRRKSLWLWGFLVAGEPLGLYQILVYGPGFQAGFKMMEQGISHYVVLITFVVAIYFALEAFFAPVLIHAAAKIDGYGDYDVKEAMDAGLVNWGRFIALDFLWLGAFALVVFLLVVSGTAIASVSKILGLLYFIAVGLVGVTVSSGLVLALTYIRRLMVLEKSRFLDSIHDGFLFLLRNKAASIVTVVILTLVYFGWFVVLVILLTAKTLAQGGFPAPEDVGQFQSGSLDWVLGFLDIIISSIFMTVATNLFTLLFLRLRPAAPQSQPIPEVPPLPT